MESEDQGKKLRSFVEFWNQNYPIDKWWRDKYNIPFGSKLHKEQGVLDMRIDFEEDLMHAEALIKIKEREHYEPSKGLWLKKKPNFKPTRQEIERDFDNIDLGNIQANSREEIVDGKTRIII